MRYRIEFGVSFVEGNSFGKREFDAETDEEASTEAVQICHEEQIAINVGIENPFWHCRVQPMRLIKIEQSEISHEIPILEMQEKCQS